MHAENPANAPKSYQSPKANKPTSVSTCNTEHIVSNYFLKGLSPLLKSEFLGMYKKEKTQPWELDRREFESQLPQVLAV